MKQLALVISVIVFLSGCQSTGSSLNFRNEDDDLYLFDAQSQFNQYIKVQEVLDIIARSGVQRVTLSTVLQQSNDIVYEIAKQDPERIIPGARLKLSSFHYGPEAEFRMMLDRQLARRPKYSVITEALIYHARKIASKYQMEHPEISTDPSSPQLQYVIKRAKELDIPVVLHVESRSLAPERRLELWGKLEKLMRENSQVSFVYTHIAQLDPKDVVRLINQHENIYFFLQVATLTENRLFARNTLQPVKFTCVFCEKVTCKKGDLKPDWEKLFIDHSNRFIFAMDVVEWWMWKDCYQSGVMEWKIAISRLPKHVGRKIAHENAERLWHIKTLYQY
jgi:predicted TIM-barrel fold metal-dependent hydrolase